MDAFLAYETYIRLSVFLGLVVLFMSWERLAPKRALLRGRKGRWRTNGAIIAIDTLALRLLFPVAAIGAALWAQAQNIGLLNWLAAPLWLAIPLAFLFLDFAIWLQHLLFHRVPLLWRLHRMHHTDVDVDVTTGLRFHPLEMILSMVIKIGVVILIGAPAVAVLLFEVVLNATSLFNHSNIRLPVRADRLLRWWVVTPDMHRVHHSWHPHETNSNYGFNLPWWDRLFRTYRDQPEAGHQDMTLGLEDFRDEKDNALSAILRQPWRNIDHEKH